MSLIDLAPEQPKLDQGLKFDIVRTVVCEPRNPLAFDANA